jgi:hypothetical protein
VKQIGEFKQKLLKINNQVNQDLYGMGLMWQKIDIIEDRIIIVAGNKRIPALAKIDDKSAFTTRLMDLALLNEFKIRLREEFENNFPYKIKSVMKDYDPKAQLAATIIILENPLEI